MMVAMFVGMIVAMLMVIVIVAVMMLVQPPRQAGPQPPEPHHQDHDVGDHLDVACLAQRAEQACREEQFKDRHQQQGCQRVGEGDPGAGEDAFHPAVGTRAVEEVGHHHRLAVARPQRVHHAIAEADDDQRPQRQRAGARLDVLQGRRQRALDALLILRREARQLLEAIAEDQGADQPGQERHPDPQEGRAQETCLHGERHDTTPANTG